MIGPYVCVTHYTQDVVSLCDIKVCFNPCCISNWIHSPHVNMHVARTPALISSINTSVFGNVAPFWASSSTTATTSTLFHILTTSQFI